VSAAREAAVLFWLQFIFFTFHFEVGAS